MAEEDKQGGEESPQKPKVKVALLPLLIAAINILGSGAGVGLVYYATLGIQQKTISEEEELKKLIQSEEMEELEIAFLYTFDEFRVNLAEQNRAIQVEISVEMLEEEGFMEIIDKKGLARDVVIESLSQKTYMDLASIHGKLLLKDEIISGINARLETGVVKNIFFSRFIIQ